MPAFSLYYYNHDDGSRLSADEKVGSYNDGMRGVLFTTSKPTPPWLH